MSEKHTNKNTNNNLTPGEKRAAKASILVGAALLATGIAGAANEKVKHYEHTGEAPVIAAEDPVDWVSGPVAKMVIEVADLTPNSQRVEVHRADQVSQAEDITLQLPPK